MPNPAARVRPLIRSFGGGRRGALAPIAAIIGLVLILVAGASVDIARAARVHSLLQDDADSAALAGAAQTSSSTALASAATYMTAALANLTDKPSVSASYTYDDKTSAVTPTMTVTLTATLPTTLMSVWMSKAPVTVTATAQGTLVKKVTVALTNFSTSAADTDVIYGYGYDPTAYSTTSALYAYAPATTAMTQLLSNKTSSTGTTVSFTIPYADTIAFALSNTTGSYTNCYGQTAGSTILYYSHRTDTSGDYNDVPSKAYTWCGWSYTSNGIVYGNDDTNCSSYTTTSLQKACVSNHSGQTWDATYKKGSSYTYAAGTAAARNPLELSSNTQDCTGSSGVTYSWDDNGGDPDDSDFNDMVYTVTCTKAVSGSTVKLVS